MRISQNHQNPLALNIKPMLHITRTANRLVGISCRQILKEIHHIPAIFDRTHRRNPHHTHIRNTQRLQLIRDFRHGHRTRLPPAIHRKIGQIRLTVFILLVIPIRPQNGTLNTTQLRPIRFIHGLTTARPRQHRPTLLIGQHRTQAISALLTLDHHHRMNIICQRSNRHIQRPRLRPLNPRPFLLTGFRITCKHQRQHLFAPVTRDKTTGKAQQLTRRIAIRPAHLRLAAMEMRLGKRPARKFRHRRHRHPIAAFFRRAIAPLT